VRAGSALLAAGLALGLSLALGCSRQRSQEGQPGPETVTAAPESPDAPEAILVFPDRQGRLVPVRRPLVLSDDPETRIRQLLLALLAGPGDEALAAPFGEEVTLGTVDLDARGVVYVDLVSEALPDPPAGGSQVEMQRVFSVVDTVLLDDGPARVVVLLWNGRQRSTFGGHVNTGQPLGIDRSLLRSAPE
jgi:hypothetical protein